MFLAFLLLTKPGSLYNRTEPPKCQNLDSVSFTPPSSTTRRLVSGRRILATRASFYTTYICHLQKWADT